MEEKYSDSVQKKSKGISPNEYLNKESNNIKAII